MDSNSHDTGRSTSQNKLQWIECEDMKLIEAILDLHNTGKYTTEGESKSGFFSAVERILFVTLPDSGLKAEPHIKPRVKTLKQNFAIVHDMLCEPNTSGFGYDDTTKCVIAERTVWDAYIQSHMKVHMFRDRPFPFYKELCTIFGKDRATSKYAKSPADAVEDLDKEEMNPIHDTEDDINGDDLEGMEFSMTGDQPPDVGASDSTPKTSTLRMKKRRKGPSLQDSINEVMDRTVNVMTTTMKKTTAMLSESIRDPIIGMKLSLFTELRMIEGLTVEECHQAIMKIGQSSDLTVIFFALPDSQKLTFVRSIL